MSIIPNVLAERYASAGMTDIWSPSGKIRLERELWIAVMKAQADLGVAIPAAAIASYEAVRDRIDPAAIQERERVTRHDVKARIDEFCALAGCEHIHKGMTSRDLTENVEQLQVFRSLELVLVKGVALMAAMMNRAREHRDTVLAARTHNVVAQLTTLGKRIAMFAGELEGGLAALEHLIRTYPVRGIKGASGTQLDQLNLFGGDSARVQVLEEKIAAHLGLPSSFVATGQVYPRSLDFRVVSALCDVASGPSGFARTLRLMAGHELAGEGFAPGQTGSSAMPHKMNSRSCERINGFHTILKGHVTMAAGLAGDQWNEGDVSCSVVRRVVLPDAFFALDGLLETALTVVGQMEVYPAVIRRETEHYLPFLLSTAVLMEAVKGGAGRETAHEAIREHAVSVAQGLRDGTMAVNDLPDRLAGDSRLGLSRDDLQRIFEENATRTGAAGAQVDVIADHADEWLRRYPAARDVKPGTIL